MATDLLIELFTVAVVAGCFDAIAGGGGLITVPMLLLAGLDPVSALGTNKLQASFGSLSATIAFARRGFILWRTALPVAAAAALASIAGALSAYAVPTEMLAAIIPVLLIVVAVYFALNRRLRDEDTRARLPLWAFSLCVVPLIGFYDGLFGPGAGAFYLIGFVTILGYGVLKATGYTKLANAASNIGSLFLFTLTGSVLWDVGLIMAIGAFLGAQLGARLALRLGAALIRPLLVIISSAMAVKLLWSTENALAQYLHAWLSAF